MVTLLCAQRTALFGVFLVLGISSAPAQTAIGNAPVVRNDVQGTLVSGVVAVRIGDSVFRDEGMRTGSDSEARIVFLDNTNVSLGPNSNLKLDKFVYSDQGAQAVTVNVSKGLLRFVTGNGDKNAYKINTPVATIGVRGTVFDVVADDGHTSVTLLEGTVLVCQQNARHCTTLNQPNQQAKVSSTGISKGSGPSPFQTATGCSAGLCDTSTYVADLQNDSLPTKLPLYTAPLPAPPSVLPPVPPNAVGQNDSGTSTQSSNSRFTGGGLTISEQCAVSPTRPGVGNCAQ
jgi:hypothetical protein